MWVAVGRWSLPVAHLDLERAANRCLHRPGQPGLGLDRCAGWSDGLNCDVGCDVLQLAPTGERVFVKCAADQKKTAGGVLLPEASAEKATQGARLAAACAFELLSFHPSTPT